MNKTIRNIGLAMMVLGLLGLLIGVAFLVQGYTKQVYLVDSMKQEGIKLGELGITGPDASKVVDNAEYAQIVADKVRADRHQIAPNYEALLGGNHFDPTNPKQLSYAQALNLENYLYLAVASFGLIDIAIGTGGFMIITGIALGIGGFALFGLSTKKPANTK
jgi:hypothetical protein